jgi:hypothetical protein
VELVDQIVEVVWIVWIANFNRRENDSLTPGCANQVNQPSCLFKWASHQYAYTRKRL